MPAWSEEIADLMLEFARVQGRSLDQLQLQKLVYIAHGWQLAFTDQPLTGDRPEATSVGPTYRRMSERFRLYGAQKLGAPLQSVAHLSSILDQSEVEIVSAVAQTHGELESFQLSGITRHPDSAWALIYGDGSGEGQDIPHNLVRAQFERLATLRDKRNFPQE